MAEKVDESERDGLIRRAAEDFQRDAEESKRLTKSPDSRTENQACEEML